ncbi:MAG: hypothetical protein CBB71_02840 [Rhodopirellula sp. TMED11]|nr:MAG: hypothetical protein CBB71_02840 [Rhodopirellula sp. TMED11]
MGSRIVRGNDQSGTSEANGCSSSNELESAFRGLPTLNPSGQTPRETQQTPRQCTIDLRFRLNPPWSVFGTAISQRVDAMLDAIQ